jgi:hypothetical protein
VLHFLNKNQLEYRVTIEDVQRLTVQREKSDAFPSWAKPNASVPADPLLSSFFRKRLVFSFFCSTKQEKRLKRIYLLLIWS